MRALAPLALAAAFVAAAAAPAGAAASAQACAQRAPLVEGRVPGAFATRTARVAVVADSPDARTYVLGLRSAVEARRSPSDAFALLARQGDFGSAAAGVLRDMRLAPVDAHGAFACGGLAPGAYLAIAFASGTPGASVDPRTMIVLVSTATVHDAGARITSWTVFGDR